MSAEEAKRELRGHTVFTVQEKGWSRKRNSELLRLAESQFDVLITADQNTESLLVACGAEISEGRGSRVRLALKGVRAVFHRPHPRKETDKGAVVAMRRFLTEAGVTL